MSELWSGQATQICAALRHKAIRTGLLNKPGLSSMSETNASYFYICRECIRVHPVFGRRLLACRFFILSDIRTNSVKSAGLSRHSAIIQYSCIQVLLKYFRSFLERILCSSRASCSQDCQMIVAMRFTNEKCTLPHLDSRK